MFNAPHPMHHFAVFKAYVPIHMLLTPVCAFFFHPFPISLVICYWTCNMMHVFPVSYPFLVYSNCSACSLPHFYCPFSYTLTELCFFLSFTASHLLQPSCSSFCQQSFIMPFVVNPSMLFSLFISLFTFILPIALAYCFALVVHACCSISALHAINAPCSTIDCHFILLVIWFMPVIHSLLLIYTQLLLASCLSFGSCSSCHATWPPFVVLLVLLSASHSYFIHADCLVCVCYAIPACQFILACPSLVLVNQFVQFMLIILLGLVILPMFVVWVVLTLFDLCSLCSLCSSRNLPYLWLYSGGLAVWFIFTIQFMLIT